MYSMPKPEETDLLAQQLFLFFKCNSRANLQKSRGAQPSETTPKHPVRQLM